MPATFIAGLILAGILVATLLPLGIAWRWRRQWRALKASPALTPRDRAQGLQASQVEAGGYRIFARLVGPPAPPGAAAIAPVIAPVILVHGLVISSRYMTPLALALLHQAGAGRLRILAPDLPGFGESAKPPRVLSLAELAEALHLWLKAQAIGKAILIGNSFGCQVITQLAVMHPEVIDRLVLQGPTTDPAARSLPRQVWRDLVNQRREPGGVARIARIDYAKAGLGRAFATMRICIRDRPEERLPLITAPALVVHGTRDPVVPQAWAERVAALLPQGRITYVAGGTHTLNYAYPAEMAAAILPFILAERATLLGNGVARAG